MIKLFSWFTLVLFLACSGNNSSESDYGSNGVPVSEVAEFEEMDISAKRFEVASQVQEKKIIKNSYLRFETKDLEKTYTNILNQIKEAKGYIQNDESGKGYSEYKRTLIVRVPNTSFQNVIDKISEEVSYFDTKRISARDVTEEFIDLEARLKAKKTLENRYLELLNKAKNVKEILEIERELSTIREEIEAKEGRLKYLQNQVSYSTITIEFYKLTTESRIRVSYGAKIWKALSAGFDGLSVFFLGVLTLWPFVIIVILITYFIRKKYFKKTKS